MDCAVILVDLKYDFNLESAYRVCANFGASRLYWTGTRVLDPPRHPRPKRGRGRSRAEAHFDDFSAVRGERQRDPLALIGRLQSEGYTPVAVELVASATSLERFTHPERAVYVLGPEDGSLSEEVVKRCAKAVRIPSDGCLNVAMAASAVLLHRRLAARSAGRLRAAV